MRMAELSTVSGVPIPTIKYYLREGLLPAGDRTSATQATYDDAHVRRLRVIRALLDTGASVAGTRHVLATLDEPPEDPTELLGAAHAAAAPTSAFEISTSEAESLADRLGFSLDSCDHDRLADVARALHVLGQAGFEVPDDVMTTYVAHMKAIASAEIAGTPIADPEESVRYVVLGTTLIEPLLLALRRMAQQVESRELFSPDE